FRGRGLRPRHVMTSQNLRGLVSTPSECTGACSLTAHRVSSLRARDLRRLRALTYGARCINTDGPRLLAYMGRYRSVLYIVATSNLRGPSLGSGMDTSS